MRLSHVRLAAGSFSLFFVGSAALVAWLVQPRSVAAVEPEPPVATAPVSESDAGRALYEVHCAMCHPVEELTPALRGEEPLLAALAMLGVLAPHGDGDSGEDSERVRFLARAAGSQ